MNTETWINKVANKTHTIRIVTEREIYVEPKKMLLKRNENDEWFVNDVIAFFPERAKGAHAICIDGFSYPFLAEILEPVETKDRPLTMRELLVFITFNGLSNSLSYDDDDDSLDYSIGSNVKILNIRDLKSTWVLATFENAKRILPEFRAWCEKEGVK